MTEMNNNRNNNKMRWTGSGRHVWAIKLANRMYTSGQPLERIQLFIFQTCCCSTIHVAIQQAQVDVCVATNAYSRFRIEFCHCQIESYVAGVKETRS